jgi:nucleoside-diphosphate-sugar epimerase
MVLPSEFGTVPELEAHLSQPTPEVVEALAQLDGDVMVLGAGGKMGPTLALLAARSVAAGGLEKRVIGVSRFSDARVARTLAEGGVETIALDMMEEGALDRLPGVKNIVYMVGSKFGTTGQEGRTWAINAFLPGVVARRFRSSRFVVFSSGNVYPLSPVARADCTEEIPPAPIGEYAQSVLGRERVFSYFSEAYDIPAVLFRLNYAVEVRYGVLLDIARKVWLGEPVDLSMGHVNVIWQGDANAYALRALALAETPPLALNVTGPETLSVRALARRFGELLGRTPVFVGAEAPDALLSDAQQAFTRMGYPRVPVGKVIEWVAGWIVAGGAVYDKPTKYQVRNGRF